MDADGPPRTAAATPTATSWRSAWPDALAFAGGLGLAWWFGWQTRDLVWSLWLASLLVGYATIIWMIFRPAFDARRAAADGGASGLVQSALGGIYVVGGLFLLAFFTFHFGMFHFVHSVFLNLFFPVFDASSRGFPSPALYWHVLGAYWPFVLVAAVAERGGFERGPAVPASLGASGEPVTKKPGDAFMAPYKNVVRMHLMIFFFAFASFVRLENFFVYAIVYAVYFFPWRMLKPTPAPPAVT